MDLVNQKRVKEFVEQYGAENIVVLLGAAEGEGAEGEGAGLAAETVTNGDPTFAGSLAGVSLGLRVYHVCEPAMGNRPSLPGQQTAMAVCCSGQLSTYSALFCSYV